MKGNSGQAKEFELNDVLSAFWEKVQHIPSRSSTSCHWHEHWHEALKRGPCVLELNASLI